MSEPRIWVAGDDPAWREQVAGELGEAEPVAALDSADVAVVSATWWRANKARLTIPAIVIGVAADAELLAAEAAGDLYQLLPFERRPHELIAGCRRAAAYGSLVAEVVAEQQIEMFEALDRLARTVGELSSHEELAREAAVAAAEFIDSDLVAFLLATDDGGAILQLHLTRSIGVDLLQELRDDIVERFRSLTGEIVESALTVHVSGAPLVDSRVTEERPDVIALHQSIDLPGEAIGLISLCRVGGRPFSGDEEDLAEHYASRVAESADRVSVRWASERRRLSLMVESMADGLILTDRFSDRVLINPAARRLLELEPDAEITQSSLRDQLGFYPFDLIAGTENSGPLYEEVSIGDRVLHSMVSPVRDGGGRLLGVVVVLRDFTDAKALARRQKEFVSVVSHELRTPLTSIAGALDIALSEYAGRLNDKQRRYLTMARDSCTRLNAIVDDLLDIARSEEGRMPIRFTPLALDELTREVAESYRPPAQAKNIRLHVRRENTSMRIAGDADRLTQVLNNLLSNAIKFTPEGGTIEVEIFGPAIAEGHVGVSVYNTGDPIPPSDRERIFEKFEQLEGSSTRRFGGTGLGLAISRAIIEAHHGRIWVDPRDLGTKFIFTLPVAPDADEIPDEVELAQSEAPVSGASLLVVEPDVHSSYILKGMLMGSGHVVDVVGNSADALTAARRDVPDLVIISADGSDELEIIEILRHDPDTHKCAIIGIGDPETVELFAARGAHTFLPKPLDPTKLNDAVNRLIADSSQAASSRILVIDDDLSIRIICREVLTSAGYMVRTAASGAAGLDEAKEFRPDLILLDVMMPQLDGFATAERFATDAGTALTPIIFLSARGETEDKLKAFKLGAEDYIVKPFVADEMLARVRKALDRRARELGASPTTQLPGSAAIEAEIDRRLGNDNTAFCYLDLDNLKAFNDYYGYAKADGVIRQTGDLVRDVIRREGGAADFIGHIAGDDFVFITDADRADAVCSSICRTFDRLIPLYYNKVDRERGYIETKDRYGVLRKFPIMGVSLAAVTAGEIASYSQLAAAAAEGKKLAKAVPGSTYVRDGETVWQGEASSEADQPAPNTPANEVG